MTTVLVCLLLLLGGMITFHHIKLHYEQSAIRPNGKMVSVDSAELHVYAQGEQQEKLLQNASILYFSNLPRFPLMKDIFFRSGL